MKTFIISFELKQELDYTSFFEALMFYSDWTPLTQNAWLIYSDCNSIDIFEDLVGYIYSLDALFVASINNDANWINLKVSDEKVMNLLPPESNSIEPPPESFIQSLKKQWNNN